MFSLKAVIQRSVQRGGGMLALWVVEADFMHSLVFLLLLESRFILLCSCCYESWDRSVVRDLWVTFRGSGNVKLLFWHWFLYIYIILFFFFNRNFLLLETCLFAEAMQKFVWKGVGYCHWVMIWRNASCRSRTCRANLFSVSPAES